MAFRRGPTDEVFILLNFFFFVVWAVLGNTWWLVLCISLHVGKRHTRQYLRFKVRLMRNFVLTADIQNSREEDAKRTHII